jgi:single-strand DNA-binding protein
MANFNLNKVILAGRLTSAVELKQTPSGVAVATFSIAVNRKVGKDKPQETDFINCTAWRGTAEFISKYFGKGSSICIVGSIQTRSWKDNNGQNRYATDVVADEAMFVDSKSDAQGTEASAPTNYIPDAYKTPQNANFVGADRDDDLPFN